MNTRSTGGWERRYRRALAEQKGPPITVPEWMLEPRWLPLAMRSHRVEVRKAPDRDVLARNVMHHRDQRRFGGYHRVLRVALRGDRLVVGGVPEDRANFAVPVFVGTVSGQERVQIEGVIRCNRMIHSYDALMLVVCLAARSWWLGLLGAVGFAVARVALLSFPRRVRQRAQIIATLEAITGGTVAPRGWGA